MKFKTRLSSKSGYFLSVLSLLLFLSSVVFAQDSEKIIRYRCLSGSGLINGIYATQSDLPPPVDPSTPTPTPDPNFIEEKLTLTGASRSPFYKCDPTKPLRIIRHKGDKITVLATIDFSSPQSPKLPLLLFLNGKTSEFEIRVVDDDPDFFPGGSFLFINFSGMTATSTFHTGANGIVTATLAPNEAKLVNPTAKDFDSATLTLKIPSKTQPVYSSAWTLRKQLRYLMFIVTDPRDKNSVIFLRVADNMNQLVDPDQKIPQSP